ncbi:MMPL family transporter [Pseudophaeobacter sp.]|uniref:MMPL family transporter n=1 Tax=Pseudophaeobacter sp. TaxID=1971739 RepID=UPI004058984F
MTRTILATLGLIGLILLFAPWVTISSDTEALIVGENAGLPSLTEGTGLDVLVALSHPQVAQRNQAAKAIAQHLKQDPLVSEVLFSTPAPSEEFDRWIWENRLLLAPPEQADLESQSMSRRLVEAKDYFSDAASIVFGDRFLRDPTGSYWRIVKRFENPKGTFPVEDGVWQSSDNSAAILHIRLVQQPFDAQALKDWSAALRDLATQEKVTAHLLGVRVIAAETTHFNSAASARASVIASLLLVIWLIWSLRSVLLVVHAFLPLALGVTSAIGVVNLAFGSVHIVALAFGGVLLGLALDYPIHVMAHHGSRRSKAHRLILLGAATTGLSFLAMVGSQVPALVQTGVFILVGLSIAAIASVAMPVSKKAEIRGVALSNFGFYLPAKTWIETVLILAGLVTAVLFNQQPPIALFEPPEHIRTELAELNEKLDLPSSTYAIDVEGETLGALLENEVQLAVLLDQAIEDGALQSYQMLSQWLSPSRALHSPVSGFRAEAELALQQAGMAVAFAEQQTLEFERALLAPGLQPEDLSRFPELQGLARRLSVSEERWQERVELVLPQGSSQLDLTLTTPGAELVDLLAPIRQTMTDLRSRIASWLFAGLLCGMGLLAVGLGSRGEALRIFRTCCAVLGGSACIIIAVYGAFSIFHIVAMALVVGIGVDYDLILTGMKGDKDSKTSARSVFVCAGSTLIAFLVLSLSEVQILHQIGATVTMGLMLMLFLTLAQTKRNEDQ